MIDGIRGVCCLGVCCGEYVVYFELFCCVVCVGGGVGDCV